MPSLRQRKYLLLLLMICSCCWSTVEGNPEPVFRSVGDLRLTFLVNECSNSVLSDTLIDVSVWLCDRVNFLAIFGQLKLGADIYQGCDIRDLLDPVVDAAKIPAHHHLGIIAWNPVPRKIQELGHVLDIPIIQVIKQWKSMVFATVELLSSLNWNENITIIVDDPNVLTLFNHESRKVWICVKTIKTFRDSTFDINYNNPIILFGDKEMIYSFLKATNHTINQLMVVPLDNSQIEGLPNGTFVIQPIFTDTSYKLTTTRKILPSPILFDLALPLMNIVRNISEILNECHNQSLELCSITKMSRFYHQNHYIESEEILNYFKIESLRDKFLYNIFRIEYFDLVVQKSNESNVTVLQSSVKVATYGDLRKETRFSLDPLFVEVEKNETLNSSASICFHDHKICVKECLNFQSTRFELSNRSNFMYNIILKQEPWVLAILSIASLGVVFTLAILFFIFIRLCKGDIFEGNPILSVLLLLTLTIMYSSVVPFTLDLSSEVEFTQELCLIRTLSVTLTYSCAFSLILSRCIMLATVTYEAGFMSHITGHVQSFLCVFMIAVQGALSLQSVEICSDLFISNSFLYILAYDILLLFLLLLCCPFVYRSQRNYKEGGYFSLAILLISFVWLSWLIAFNFVASYWKLMVVCLGLLGTASCILGAVFIPRTYLMMSAVVRDSLTSALPSLAFANSNSVLDLNYTNIQHIYDCVNIATINAAQQQQCNPNFYSDEPGIETQNQNSDSPCEMPDKVTRF